MKKTILFIITFIFVITVLVFISYESMTIKSKCDDNKDQITVSLNQEFKIAEKDVVAINNMDLAFEIEKIYYNPDCNPAESWCMSFSITIKYIHHDDKGTFYMHGLESWNRDLGVKLTILDYDKKCYLRMKIEKL